MSQIDKHYNSCTGYEYKEIIVNEEDISVWADCYKSFGWIMEEHSGISEPFESAQSLQHAFLQSKTIRSNKISNKVKLNLKRDKNIMNKTELTRLQKHFEACMNEIALLEKSITSTASKIGITIGLIGTAFISAFFFAIMHSPRLWPCVLLLIPGFAGWIFAPIAYPFVVKNKSPVIELLIDEKRKKINAICIKGCHLLG